MTVVGKNEIYNREILVRPLLVHQVLDPKPPPPLPPPLLKRSPAPCLAEDEPRATIWSLDDVLRNQFPPDCRDRAFLVFSISTTATYGFFSLMNQLIGALSAAMYLNRTLAFVTRRDQTWMYTERAECLDDQDTYQAWNCFFEPITNCAIPKTSAMQYYGMSKSQGYVCPVAVLKQSPPFERSRVQDRPIGI